MRNELAVLRLTVHRYRRIYAVFGIYAVLIVLLALGFGTRMTDVAAVPLVLLYFVGLIFTLGAFANPESDLAGDAPAVPTYLLRLPVSTRSLAVPPLVGSIVWPVLAWAVLVIGFIGPTGLSMDLLWPGGLLGAIGPSLMAVQWAPFRSGKLRLMFGLLVPTLLIGIGLWFGLTPGYSEVQLTAFFALSALVACRIAYWGLATSRTSESTRIRRPSLLSKINLPSRTRPEMPPFKSALAAQRWLEYRRQGRILPILSGTALAMLSIPLLFEQGFRLSWDPYALAPNIWVTSAFVAIPAIPLLFATVIGMGARPNETRSADGAYHLFFATRPMRSELLVRAKNQAAIHSVIITWGIALLTMFLWSLTPAKQGDHVAPLIGFILAELTLNTAVASLIAIGLLIAWTWRNLTVGSFADFLPTRFGKRIYGTVVIASGIFLYSIVASSDMTRLLNNYYILAQAILLAAVSAKVGVALAIAGRTTELRPSSIGDVVRVFATWVMGGGLVSAALYAFQFLIDPEHNLPEFFRTGGGPIFIGFLLMPLVRSLASRLAVEVGRHSVGEPGFFARWRERRRAKKAATAPAPLAEDPLAKLRPIAVERQEQSITS